MAKKSDQAADSHGTAGAVGASTGFLAEEAHLDRAALLRLGMWGVAAVAAVTVAVLASQSSMKLRRDQIAASDFTRQSQQIQSVAKQSENEVRRLASAIETLNGDRDRLFSRMSVLEHGLDSVTGSIVRQSAAVAPQPAPPAPTPPPKAVAQNPAPATAAAPVTVPVAVPVPVPAPIADPVATSTAAAVEKPKAEEKSADPAAAPKRVATAAPGPSAPPPTAEAPAATPLMAPKSMMAPPEAAAGKPIGPEPPAEPVAAVPTVAPVPPAATSAPVEKEAQPPVTVASTPPDKADGKAGANEAGTNVAPSASPSLTVKRTEFAVDVGGANSIGGLRALWRGLLKTRANAPLAALQPMIVIKEGSNGLGMQLRLVAGPLNDAATAAKICAPLIANQRPCETTVFDGQRLAIKAEQPSASAEAASRKSQSDRSALTNPELAKPDPSNPDSAKPVAAKPPGKFTRPSVRRRSYPQPVTVEEPPKPEPSLLSSFFGRSGQ